MHSTFEGPALRFRSRWLEGLAVRKRGGPGPRHTPACSETSKLDRSQSNSVDQTGAPDTQGTRRENVVPANRSLALVVRTVEVFETSLVVTLFTRELGKVAALAKGGRRLKSPSQGGLDLLSVSDIVAPSQNRRET